MMPQKPRSRFATTKPDITITLNDGRLIRHDRRTDEPVLIAVRDPYVARPSPKNGSQSLPP